jgi:poly(A) polymerase
MSEPVIVPRAEHPISRGMIDPDALKVLYRLQQFDYTAYLVGGSVRDLLLGRTPKDFDIGTSAHPYQIKKLFRNCWIIGRRFRLAHVRFGPKTIEVATFRRGVLPETENVPALIEGAEPPATHGGDDGDEERLIHRDNTFGTPEEDAFRRDFTINALFYDIATFSIIDYVGGLQDIRDRVIRSIGDPMERFQEDPVRMLRAIALAARLGFALDGPVADAIRRQRHLMALASPARLIEEYYKILRSGYAEPTFQALAEHKLLEPVTPELQEGASDEGFRDALDALDSYRQRFETAPPTLTNPILLGTLLVPLGLMPRRARTADDDAQDRADAGEEAGADLEKLAARAGRRRREGPKEPLLKIGVLPVARRDTERLRQILSLQRRLQDLESSPRAKRALLHRSPFGDAMTWLDVHGHVPEVVEHWRGFMEAVGGLPAEPEAAAAGTEGGGDDRGGRRRRGRRRRGGRRFKRGTGGGPE